MAEKDKAQYDKEITEYKKKAETVIPPPMDIKVESEEEEEEDDDDEEEDDLATCLLFSSPVYILTHSLYSTWLRNKPILSKSGGM